MHGAARLCYCGEVVPVVGYSGLWWCADREQLRQLRQQRPSRGEAADWRQGESPVMATVRRKEGRKLDGTAYHAAMLAQGFAALVQAGQLAVALRAVPQEYRT